MMYGERARKGLADRPALLQERHYPAGRRKYLSEADCYPLKTRRLSSSRRSLPSSSVFNSR